MLMSYQSTFLANLKSKSYPGEVIWRKTDIIWLQNRLLSTFTFLSSLQASIREVVDQLCIEIWVETVANYLLVQKPNGSVDQISVHYTLLYHLRSLFFISKYAICIRKETIFALLLSLQFFKTVLLVFFVSTFEIKKH